MPDINKPDWSADPAFWEEAWTNMNARLDVNSPRKPRRLLLLLLLPLLIGGGIMLWKAPSITTQTAEPASITQVEAAATVANETTGEHPVTTAEPAANSQARGEAADNMRAAPGKRKPYPNAGQHVTVKEVPANGEPNPTANEPQLRAPARRAQGIVQALESLEIQPLHYLIHPIREIVAMEGKSFIATPDRYRWTSSLGLSYFPASPSPGFFGQTTYGRKLGKWMVPLTIRAERSTRQVFTNDDLLAGLEFYPTTGFNQNAVSGTVFSDELASSGNNVLASTTLELRVGIGRYLGKNQRLLLSSGAGASYLVSGKGPAFIGDEARAGNLNVTADRLSYSGSNNSAQLSVGSSGRGISRAVDHWDLTGWLQLDYSVGRRLSLTGGWTYTATDIYTDQLLRTDRNGFTLGLGYRY